MSAPKRQRGSSSSKSSSSGGSRPNCFLGVRITNPTIVNGVRAVQASLALQQPSLAGSFNDVNTLHITVGLAKMNKDDHKTAVTAVRDMIPAIQATVANALGITATSSSSTPVVASLPFAGVGCFNGGRVIYGQPSNAPGVGAWMPSSTTTTATATTATSGSNATIVNSESKSSQKMSTRTLIATVAQAIDANLVSAGIDMIHEQGRSHGSNYVHDPITAGEDVELGDMARKFHMTIAKQSSGGRSGGRSGRSGGGSGTGTGPRWQCPTCNDGNWLFASKTSCRKCGSAKPATVAATNATAATTATSGRPGEWQCVTCNDGNWIFASKSACRKCGSAKPATATATTTSASTTTTISPASAPAKSSSGGRAGEWQCTTCNDGNWIFASKSVCRKCGTAKPTATTVATAESKTIVTITPSAAAKSSSSGKPGEWQCATCNDGNWIFASKTMCRKCFTPKPANATIASSSSSSSSSAVSSPATAPVAAASSSSSNKGIDWSVLHPLLSGSEPLHCIELLEMAGSAKRHDGYYGAIARIPLFPHLNDHCDICCGNLTSPATATASSSATTASTATAKKATPVGRSAAVIDDE